MTNETITLRVVREDYIIKYLQLRTFNLLSPVQYRVLAEIVKHRVVDTESRKEISEKVGITIFSLNNTLLKLKKKGLILHDASTQTYTPRIEVPSEPGSLTFKFTER